MAVDFFIMPLSRYLTGSFVTPAMEVAWSMGIPYSIIGTAGTRTFPNGQPYGGDGAHERRDALLASKMLADDLAKYPPSIRNNLWDEASAHEPRFHRVDSKSYAALVEEIDNQRKPGLWGLINRKVKMTSHLGCMVFFPAAFEEVFLTPSVLEQWQAGSVQAALRELKIGNGSANSALARATLTAALEDAAELNLPMIVDL
jgi:hypothetical protein